jgi:pimeloyl-ACP methyl ester carboxylesterase
VSPKGLAADVVGEGPAVVLLHGQPGSARDWAPVIPLLAEHRTVVVPDRPGYGRTGGPAQGFRANASAVLGLLDRLGLGRASFAAHSWAGGVALALAQDDPDRVGGLALIASVSPGQHLGALDRALAIPGIGAPVAAVTLWMAAHALSLPPIRQAIDRRLRGITDENLSAMASAWVHGDVWRSFVVEQRALVDELPSLARGLGAITAPTVVLVGAADRIVPASAGEHLAATIPGARLVRLNGAGHLLAHEHPATVAGEILQISEMGA